MKKNRNTIIIAVIVIIILMAIAYSSFATSLKINGTAKITGEWNIKIIGIEAIYTSNGCNSGEPEYTVTTATFNAELKKPRR